MVRSKHRAQPSVPSQSWPPFLRVLFILIVVAYLTAQYNTRLVQQVLPSHWFVTAPQRAFMFLKPHAVTDQVKQLVENKFTANGVQIVQQGSISSSVIDRGKLIDNHYYAIASKATLLQPQELRITSTVVERFSQAFGVSWQVALEAGQIVNGKDGCSVLGISAAEMDEQWSKAKQAGLLVKLSSGFYCARIGQEGHQLFVLNGFFMSMRDKYTAPGQSVYFYVVEWDEAALSWHNFRANVLGATDPTAAPAESIRGLIWRQWGELGLSHEPDIGNNGMHGSASPFEAMVERMNWLGVELRNDPFGRALIRAGVPEEWIDKGRWDPQVVVDADGHQRSLFDVVEDLDTSACLDKLISVQEMSIKSKDRISL